MVDEERVCCLCGDVGFPDKLFPCSRCHFRFQHSYCSSYYCGSGTPELSICDWCQSEVVIRKHGGGGGGGGGGGSVLKRPEKCHIRSEYTSRERVKHHHHHHHEQKQDSKVKFVSNRKNVNTVSPLRGVPSPRTNGHRRYKLLKDVMC